MNYCLGARLSIIHKLINTHKLIHVLKCLFSSIILVIIHQFHLSKCWTVIYNFDDIMDIFRHNCYIIFFSENAFDIVHHLFSAYNKNPQELKRSLDTIRSSIPPPLAASMQRPQKEEAVTNYVSRYTQHHEHTEQWWSLLEPTWNFWCWPFILLSVYLDHVLVWCSFISETTALLRKYDRWSWALSKSRSVTFDLYNLPNMDEK